MDPQEELDRSLRLDQEIRKQKRYCLIFFTFSCLCMMTVFWIAASVMENPAIRLVLLIPMLGPLASFPIILRRADWKKAQLDYIATGRLDRRRWTLGKMLVAMCIIFGMTIGGATMLIRMNRDIEQLRDRIHAGSIG